MKHIVLLSTAALLLAGCNPRPEPAPVPASPTMEMPVAANEDQIEHVDVERARALFEQRAELVILDVRTPAEYDAGHIPGALNFDMNAPDFAQRINQLDKYRPYMVHDATGVQSTNSLETFSAGGFYKIYHLDGGMAAWHLLRYPVVPSMKLK